MSIIPSIVGIILQDLENKKKETKFTIHDISYCCAEPGVHERIFTWISKDKEAKRLDCHAVLCASKEKAQAVAMVLSRAFHMAYKDWKNDKEKSARLKNGKLADASSLSGSTSGRVSRSGSDVSRASSSDKSMETAMHNMTIASGSKDDDFFIVNNVVIESNSNGNNNTKPAMPEPWYRCVLLLCQCSEIVFVMMDCSKSIEIIKLRYNESTSIQDNGLSPVECH